MTQAISRIQEITAAIKLKLDNIQAETQEVGALLKEVLEEFKAQGKNQAAFLEYCKGEFAIGKAQAYKLIAIYETFGEDKRFKGVSMRVLYTLASVATKEQVDRAAEFAESGSLTTSIVNELLNPTPIPPEVALTGNGAGGEVSEEAKKKLLDIQATLDAQALKDEERIKLETEKVKEGDNTALASLQASLDEQSQTIKLLTEELSKANALVKELTAPSRAKTSAPFLPQFNHESPFVVLGLSESESKQVTKVKKAFRDIIKCGYGEGHEAFTKLTAAKDALLAAIEESK